MRLATCEVSGTVAAGVIRDDGFHPLPDDATILDLVRSGLPAALDAGARSLGQPAVPLTSVRFLPPLEPPTVRDFAAFEEHVEGLEIIPNERIEGVATIALGDLVGHQRQHVAQRVVAMRA